MMSISGPPRKISINLQQRPRSCFLFFRYVYRATSPLLHFADCNHYPRPLDMKQNTFYVSLTGTKLAATGTLDLEIQ